MLLRQIVVFIGLAFFCSSSAKSQNINISHLEVMLSLKNQEVTEILGDNYEYLGEQFRGSKTINMWIYKADNNIGISRIIDGTTQYVNFITTNNVVFKKLKEFVAEKYPNVSKTNSNLYRNKYKNILYQFKKYTLPNGDYGYTVTVSDSFIKTE